MLAQRRVRRLKLRGQGAVEIPRVKTLLEEAIRTASLPNIPLNGVICIRRLDLGRISASANSRFLSRRLDQLVRNLTLTEITVENPEHDDADVVWFADAIEPYRRLSELLVSGRPALAWYWPVVIPGWEPTMNLPESCLLFISRLAQEVTAMTGLSYALEPFVQAGSIIGILQKIRPDMLSAALTALPMAAVAGFVETLPGGHPDPVAAAAGRIEARLAKEWKLILRQALKCWPAGDARLRLVFNLVLNVAGMPPNRVNARALMLAILSEDMPRAVRDSSPALPQRDPVAGVPPADTNPREGDRERLDAARVDDDRNTPGGIELPPQTGDLAQRNHDLPLQRPEPGEAPLPGLRPEKSAEPVPMPTDRPAPIPEQYLLTGNYSGEISAYGGFLFLIPLMYRLGMAELMENDTAAADPQLLHRVLWRIAEWLRIPADDPVLQFLGDPVLTPTAPVPFAAPAAWRLLLEPDTGLDLVRVCKQPGLRLLRDPRSRLVMGLWRPGAAAQLRAWLEKYPLQSGAKQIETWQPDDLVINLVVAICRYLRQYSGMNMRVLVRRPAYIAITRTHVDWSASLASLDNRVRMAGLDIDPGWVPWLQRVFCFHYFDGEN